jgi:tetratricopeptide (TPR) repeat protein
MHPVRRSTPIAPRPTVARALSLAILLVATLPASGVAAAPLADVPAFREAMAAYRARAALDRHQAAWQGFVDVAAARPDDHEAQVWCARTSFFLAHRLVQAGRKKDCARTAEAGVACSLRAQQIRPRDYDGRYWELMNRYKAAATMNLVKGFQAAKPMRAALEDLIARDPKRHEGHVFLAMAYRELPSTLSWGDDAKALEHARKGVERAPRDPEALLELAECLRENGHDDEARRHYRAVQSDSDAPPHLEWETEDARRWARRQLKSMD